MLIPVPGGGRLHVSDLATPRGDSRATPLLLLHGFMGGGEAWPERLVEGLAQHRRVLVVDLPGHGASDRSTRAERYDITTVVSDLAAALDALGVQQADWVGYSMGGRVALSAAISAPGRVRRLVLESASPGLETEDSRSLRRTHDEALASRLESEPFETFVDDWMAMPLFQSRASLGAEWTLQDRTRRLANSPAALAACLRGLGTGSQPSYWHLLDSIAAPTLLITGALDAKFEDIAARMSRHLVNGLRSTVAGAGHTVHAESAAEWLERVNAFLGRPE